MLNWLRTLLRGGAWAPRPKAPGSALHSAPRAPSPAGSSTAIPAGAPPRPDPGAVAAVPAVAAVAAVPAVPAVAAVPAVPAVAAVTAVTAPPEPIGPDQPDPRIEQAVAALTAHFASHPPRLGSFPGTAARILQIFQGADPDFNRVVHDLQHDAAVVAKLLAVANSAFYGGSAVEDVRGAVVRIGIQGVEQIALGVASQSLFEPSSRSAFSLLPAKWNELFHTSMSAAFATSWLSQVARVGRSDHAFLTGLLHDVGLPTALRGLAELIFAGTLDRGVLDVTDAILGRVHVELGRSATTAAELPAYLCAAASLHHEAEVPAGPDHAEVHLVRIIDGIAAQRRGALAPDQDEALRRSTAALSLEPRWIRVATTEYETLAAQVTRMFGVADPFAPQAGAAAAGR